MTSLSVGIWPMESPRPAAQPGAAKDWTAATIHRWRLTGPRPLLESKSMGWTPPPPRAGHPYYMHDAIYAQPGALRLVTRGQETALAAAAGRLRAMERVLLSGIGTSWHATLVGELLFAHVGHLGHRVRAFHSFEFKNSWPEPDPRTGVVVLSHRGTKRFSLEALAKAKAGGGLVRALTRKRSREGLANARYTPRTVEQEGSAHQTTNHTRAMLLPAPLAAEKGG